MANSAVSICNSAIVKLGGQRITSLTDNTAIARLCNEQFTKLRDEVLRSHPWNFALERAELASVAGFVDPLGEYNYKFQVPVNCLRVLNASDSDTIWKREGNHILSNDSTFKIKYIKQVTDYALYDANFLEALALRIAVDLSYAVMQSAKSSDQLWKAYKMVLSESRSLDAQEGTPDPVIVDDWTNARI